jgi:hypothetical protein
MKLPNGENAYIPSPKLVGSLLSETHAAGRPKARFWRAIGFDETNVAMLERGLLAIVYSEDVTEVVSSPHGVKYIIEGTLRTPTGRTVQVRTVWIIEASQNRPRFVTAYPA